MRSPAALADAADAALIALAKAGDDRAFEVLVDRRQSWLRQMFRRLSGDAALADDLSQQVFLLAWRDLDKLQVNAAFHSWLKRIAVNTWLQHLREQKGRRLVPQEEAIDEPSAAWSGQAVRERDLDGALARLPELPRLCLVLSYCAGLSHAEIADQTGMPLGTVKSHIHRGAAQLRGLLAGYEEEAST